MLGLYYAPGACSLGAHIMLEESGEPYDPLPVNLPKGEHRTPEYLKINPLGRVPVLRLDNGEPLTENTAIMSYLGKRFGMWPTDPISEAKAISALAFFATNVHPAHAHVGRPERYTDDPAAIPSLKEKGLKTFHDLLKQADDRLAGREWFMDSYTAVDAYAFIFWTWGMRRELPMRELKNFAAHRDRMVQRRAVQHVVEDEKLPT